MQGAIVELVYSGTTWQTYASVGTGTASLVTLTGTQTVTNKSITPRVVTLVDSIATNVQTFSWNAIFQGSTDLPLATSSTGSSKYDYFGFIYNSAATKWQYIAELKGF